MIASADAEATGAPSATSLIATGGDVLAASSSTQMSMASAVSAFNASTDGAVGPLLVANVSATTAVAVQSPSH